jgi:putative ABC transport system substrate-binding protein
VIKACLLPFILLAGVIVSFAARSLTLSVGVIYPDVRQPYDQIFENIVMGVDQELGEASKRYRIRDDSGAAELQQWIRDESINTVVALGNGGVRAAEILGAEINIVVGAIQEAPTSVAFPGILLTPHPASLFERLRMLAPRVASVAVVYNPDRSAWLIDLALRAASTHDLELQPLVAKSLQEAALLYRELLLKAGDGSQAIWLLQDSSTLDERAILPFILQEAWEKYLVVFSSNPAHVRRGVLFSLFPDNVGMGQRLASMAKKVSQKSRDVTPTIVPLQDLFIAVNLRTADHLGLKFSARERRDFKLVFPSR